MIALPLSVLALAAGVYLLIKVNREYLGGLFKFFAWLIIALSLLAVASTALHGVHHFRHHRHCEMQAVMQGHCGMEGQGMGGEMKNCDQATSGACPMSGCQMMGDSAMLDKAVCEKMMGKEACDSVCKLRGRCIMSKDECAKMCSSAGKACNMNQKEEGKACCMHKEDGKEKACCKK